MKKRVDLAMGISFVMSLGSLVPGAGCWSGKNDNEGRICASPKEGGTYCVDSSDGPSAAWNQAIAQGSEPIEMWAIWPDEFTLTEVVSDRYLLDAWLADARDVLDYVRVTKGSAESYHATMNGPLGDDLRRARQIQGGFVTEPINPVTFVESTFLDSSMKEESPFRVRLWTGKKAFGEIQLALDQAKANGAPFAAQFKTFADDFITYRATEAAETLPS